MSRRHLFFTRTGALLVLGASALVAQGIQTGTLSVIAKDAKGAPLPGVRVVLKSDKLLGQRTGVTDASGVYRSPLLPPGTYTGVLTLDGYRTTGVSAVVPLGGATSVEAPMKPAAEAAGAVVTVISTQSKVDKSEVTIVENYSQEDILKLPVGRDLTGITALAPGVTKGAGDRLTIGGSATYENKYLVNGADINDNYFNTDVSLYIEDAIDETQVLTNNVTAEYGRFTGGIVNAITKRGGNEFAGSLRSILTNDSWNAVLPSINASPGITAVDQRSKIVNKLNRIDQATFGGPILKDRLWFFVAARKITLEDSRNLPVTGIRYNPTTDELRYEANLTLALTQDHRVGFSYLNRETTTKNRAPLVNNTAVLDGLSNRKDPLSLLTVSYDGILSSFMNLNLAFSQKKQKITSSSIGSPRNNGGTAFWQSPVFDVNGLLFNNHYFGTDPEERNNQSLKAVLTSYLQGLGSHVLKVGGEQFKEINTGTNKQSPTGYNIDADAADYTNTDNVLFDFDPTSGNAYLEDWTKAPGGTFTSTYTSAFINDAWTLNNHWNASLGFRFEKWQGSEGNSLYARPGFQNFVPRLGLTYDPKGDGVWQYSATYAEYAGKANAAIVTAGTYVGNPAVSYYFYNGPAVTGVAASATSPGFRRSDYDATPFFVSDATLNVKLSPDFKAPLTKEMTLGLKHKVSDRSNFTLTYIRRDQTRMFEDYSGMNGSVTIAGNPFSIIQWSNVGGDAQRLYTALVGTFESMSDLYGGNLYVRGNATLSKLEGNYEGDGGNSPGGGTAIGDYPLVRPNAIASGRLTNDEPVRIKTQVLWQRSIGINSLSLGLNLDYASGKPYNLTNSRRPIYNGLPIQRNPAAPNYNPGPYVDGDGSYTYYYGNRGVGRFNDTFLADFSAQWDGKFAASGSMKKVGYFVKLTAFNVLNNIQLYNWDTRQGVNNATWQPRSSFGKPNTPANYRGNRRMQIDVGFRF